LFFGRNHCAGNAVVFCFFFSSPLFGQNIKSIAKGTKDSFGNKCAKLARYM